MFTAIMSSVTLKGSQVNHFWSMRSGFSLSYCKEINEAAQHRNLKLIINKRIFLFIKHTNSKV